MALALRPLRFEQLEDKRLLAGDVTVSVVQGSLVITGDELGNQIAITSGESAGEYIVRGLEDTQLHLGDVSAPGETELLVTGVRHGIHVALNDGEDAVSLTDARVRGNVTINTGDGADHVNVGLAEALATETLAVAVVEGGVTIGGSLVIRTGERTDTVHLGGQSDTDPELIGELNDVSPSLRVGHTLVTALGDGDDEFELDAVRARWAIVVNGGEGGDTIDLSNAHTHVLTLLGGAGDFADFIGLDHVYAAVAAVGTGQGNDEVEILDSAFGILGVRLAGGDDTLSIGNTKARLATLLGGEGSGDTYNDQGGNEFRRQIIQGFEIPEDVNRVPPLVTRVQEALGQAVTVGQGLLGRLADRLRAR